MVRRAFSVRFKLKAIEWYEKNNASKNLAAKHFKIDRSVFGRWLEKKGQLLQQAGRNRKEKRLKAVKNPQEEELILRWILERRAKHQLVSGMLKMLKARSVIQHYKNSPFKVLNCWCQRFMRRNGLSLRSITSNSPWCDSRFQDPDVVEFVQTIKVHSEENCFVLWNMDETALWFETEEKKVVSKCGEKVTRVISTSSKRRCTVVLCCGANGEKLIPFIIMKGKSGKTLDRKFETNRDGYPRNVEIAHQSNSWMDEEIMIKWIHKVVQPHLNKRFTVQSICATAKKMSWTTSLLTQLQKWSVN